VQKRYIRNTQKVKENPLNGVNSGVNPLKKEKLVNINGGGFLHDLQIPGGKKIYF
jgi:hypothetical protein